MKALKVSANRRCLVRDDDTPFFWLGDTAWELFHRLTMAEAERYLENRRRKGFTVIQAVALAEFDGLDTPNVAGDRPLLERDPLRPNERYFAHIDGVLQLTEEKGLYVGLLPTWGDKVELLAHGRGPVIFNPTNARGYGEWIGRRYRGRKNLIWINGGDRSGGANRAVGDALGTAIKSVDPGHLMTFHPPGGGDGHSSSEWFHDAPWLDFNLAQSGHERKHLPNHALVAADHARVPVKPCLDGEPCYEDHAVKWRPLEDGWFDDHDVRQAAYWALCAGALGHTYGCHPVWQFYDRRRVPITFARRYWTEALDLPGAFQMGYLRALFESRPVRSRAPASAAIVNGGGDRGFQMACRGDDYLIAYLPRGGAITLRTAAIQSPVVRAWWFDPRTGLAEAIGELPRLETMEFIAPAAGPCNDWVLVLDAGTADYRAPGDT